MSETILEAAERYMREGIIHSPTRTHLHNLITEVKRLREALKLEQELRKEATRLTTIFESLINAQKDALNDVMRERRNPLAAFDDNPRTCLVKGCENKSTEGQFVGDLCASCHEHLASRGAGFKELRRIYDAMNLTGEHRCLEGVLSEYAVKKENKEYIQLAEKYLKDHAAGEHTRKENLVRIVLRLAPHAKDCTRNPLAAPGQPCTCWKSRFMAEANREI